MYLVTNLAPKLLLIYDKSHMIGAISHILEYYFLMITSSVVVTAFHYEICLTEVRWCLFKKNLMVLHVYNQKRNIFRPYLSVYQKITRE
jgi:hypothetical protein